MVVRSWVDGILKGLRSVLEDSDALTKLLLEMMNCEVGLTQMNCPGDLNSLQTMEKIDRALPNRIQELWSRAASYMLRCRNDTKFTDLRALVSREARISRSRFGTLAPDIWSHRSM